MIARLSAISLVMALVAVTLLPVGCQQVGKTEAERELDDRIEQLEELAEKRQAREKELAAMEVPQLVRELRNESERGVEPFNSMPYRELTSRGRKAAPELKTLLRDANRTSFLGLLALRQMDPTLYRELEPPFRVSVLIDALRTSDYFNAWGLPHLYWEDAAQAVIDEGQAARDLLKALLDDRRPAPMWGSEEVLEYQKYSYRVRDYAWALLKAIQGEEVEIPTDPKMRDNLISELERQP